jgi:PIN domain nuclease of toxin-antitoxin system
MTIAVLDASALLALLLAERGADRVRAVLDQSAMTVVNLGEVVGHFARHGAVEADIRQALDPLPIEWVPFDEELAYGTGLLLPATRSAGLSFGDRACLALLRRLGVKAVTADRVWSSVEQAVSVEIETIR